MRRPFGYDPFNQPWFSLQAASRGNGACRMKRFPGRRKLTTYRLKQWSLTPPIDQQLDQCRQLASWHNRPIIGRHCPAFDIRTHVHSTIEWEAWISLCVCFTICWPPRSWRGWSEIWIYHRSCYWEREREGDDIDYEASHYSRLGSVSWCVCCRKSALTIGCRVLDYRIDVHEIVLISSWDFSYAVILQIRALAFEFLVAEFRKRVEKFHPRMVGMISLEISSTGVFRVDSDLTWASVSVNRRVAWKFCHWISIPQI